MTLREKLIIIQIEGRSVKADSFWCQENHSPSHPAAAAPFLIQTDFPAIATIWVFPSEIDNEMGI